MNARLIGLVLALIAVAGAVVVVADRHDGGTYRVDVPLTTANGLRNGTVVKMSGAQIGKIRKLHIESGDRIVAELRIDRTKAAEITRGASARVVTSNLLGSKSIDIAPGPAGRPAIHAIPADQVVYPVDLDQVLNVLDADTRARLQILINEAGLGLTGRAADFNQVLRVLPHDLASAQRLVDEVTADNHSLGDAVAHSSRFLRAIAAQRAELGRLVDVARRTVATTAEHRQALRATLAEAPSTLAQAQRFLSDLERTARPLQPAAHAIAAAAPSLEATLAALPGFTAAATPTLRDARSAAPTVVRLANRTTPVVRAAVPVLRQADVFSGTLKPVSRLLDVSIDDTFGVLEGWARSIQDRDALGHIFRGKATVTPDIITSLLTQLNPAARRKGTTSGKARPLVRPQSHPAAPAPSQVPDIKLPGVPPIKLPPVVGKATGVTKTLDAGKDHSVTQLLDYLLGS